jgi:hypothetical protein
MDARRPKGYRSRAPPTGPDFSPALTVVPLVGLDPLAQPLGHRGHAVV